MLLQVLLNQPHVLYPPAIRHISKIYDSQELASIMKSAQIRSRSNHWWADAKQETSITNPCCQFNALKMRSVFSLQHVRKACTSFDGLPLEFLGLLAVSDADLMLQHQNARVHGRLSKACLVQLGNDLKPPGLLDTFIVVNPRRTSLGNFKTS